MSLRFPKGFLGFLDLKSQGKAPKDVFDSVLPVLNMERFYDASIETTLEFGMQPNTVLGYNRASLADAIVPQNEIWLIKHISMRQTTGLSSAPVCPTVSNGPPIIDTNTILLGQLAVPANSIAGSLSFTTFTGEYLMQGGREFGYWSNYAIANTNFLLTAVVVIIQV